MERNERQLKLESGVYFRLAILWVLFSIFLAILVSIPGFLLMVALTQLVTGLAGIDRTTDTAALVFRPVTWRVLSTFLASGAFLALTAVAFARANTSVVGILSG